MRKHDISCHYHLRDSNCLKGTDYVAFTIKALPLRFVLKSGQWVPVSTGTWNSEQTDYQ